MKRPSRTHLRALPHPRLAAARETPTGNHRLQPVSARHLLTNSSDQIASQVRQSDTVLGLYLISPEMKLFEPSFRFHRIFRNDDASLMPSGPRWVQSSRLWSRQTLDLALAHGTPSPYGITVSASILFAIDLALADQDLYRKELSTRQRHPANTYDTAEQMRLSADRATVLLRSHPQPHLIAHWHRLIANRVTTLSRPLGAMP